MNGSAPQPLLGFSVGIVGHRSDRIADAGQVRARITEILRALEEALDECAASGFYPAGRQPLRLVSALAEGADRIAAMAAPAAYLRRALVHEHVSGIRRLRRRVSTRTLDGHDAQTADQAVSVDLRDATWRLLATLPRQQRAVLVLRFYEDLPDHEIAEALGCTEPTVRSNASRALTTLRARLSENEEHQP